MDGDEYDNIRFYILVLISWDADTCLHEEQKLQSKFVYGFRTIETLHTAFFKAKYDNIFFLYFSKIYPVRISINQFDFQLFLSLTHSNRTCVYEATRQRL